MENLNKFICRDTEFIVNTTLCHSHIHALTHTQQGKFHSRPEDRPASDDSGKNPFIISLLHGFSFSTKLEHIRSKSKLPRHKNRNFRHIFLFFILFSKYLTSFTCHSSDFLVYNAFALQILLFS